MIRIFQFFSLFFILLIILRCANSLTPPSGGPKDITPPKVIETIPKNGSANFHTNKFDIRFNEFISLENIQSSALISPPTKELPEFITKGKSVIVKFKEELMPNTTYSVFFGEAIVDITEKNPVSNYTYIFSTGNFVDSLSLNGHVYNAFDLEPIEGMYVMLYKDNNDTITLDSLPYFVEPYYISKTDANGRFQFEGLSDDDFLLFALNDQNSNFIFDQPGEQIAFLDSVVRPKYFPKPVVDTTITDSLYNIEITPDSVIATADSLLADTTYNESDMGISLFMFLSPDTIQRLVKAEVIEKNTVLFAFSQPATNVNFEFGKFPLDSSLYVKDFSISQDTIYWYLNNPPNDSLELRLTQFNDTLGTVYLKLNTDSKLPKFRKKHRVEKKEILGWKSNIHDGKLNPDEHLEIKFLQPYVKFNNIDSTLLVAGKDSIWDPDFIFTGNLKMKISFPFDLKEGTKYRLYFPDSAFTSWNNINTKAIVIKFSTLPLSSFGILTFHLYPEKKQNYVLQLLAKDKIIVREFYFTSDTSVTFNYMKPGSYQLKIIIDQDKNNSWSTGNYKLKLQPEHVIFYTKKIKVRANWEVEEDWSW